MIIYKITHKLSGKCYIGQTTQKLSYRWNMHRNKSSPCKYLKNALHKHGIDNFSVEEIGRYKSQEDLDNAEQYFIDYYNCLAPNGYNIQLGGHGKGTMNEQTKQHLREINLGDKNAFYGKKHSAESLAKMSASLKGRPGSFKGKKHTEEAKLKVGRAHKGKKIWNEKAIIDINTGKVFKNHGEAAKFIDCARSLVSRHLRNECLHAKGHKFRYV